jgi:formylglycine-generating enzyme
LLAAQGIALPRGPFLGWVFFPDTQSAVRLAACSGTEKRCFLCSILTQSIWEEHIMSHRCATVLGVLSVALLVGSAQATDVFNMGGTRNPATGVWTGNASLEFVTVGDAGNAADTAEHSGNPAGQGAVAYNYQIGKYDVTVGQYVQFLNAVAKTDTYGLYDDGMLTDLLTVKITRSGSDGSYAYAITGGYSQAANCPVFDVSWGDAARFCNWLQNGQPTGLQGPGTTETGAYALNGAITDSALTGIGRSSGATYFIPTENEWYKAAYYRGGSANAGYWLFPTRSNNQPSNVVSPTGTDNANFWVLSNDVAVFANPPHMLTPVGAFAASRGPYETFDMGGDVWQWNETAQSTATRGIRGGSYGCMYDQLQSSWRYSWSSAEHDSGVGFRVAHSVPEPSTLVLLLAAGGGLLAYAWRRWRAV